MGGRGAGLNGGVGGGDIVIDSLTTDNRGTDDTMEFDGEMEFGTDSGANRAHIQLLESFEKNRLQGKIEYATAVSKNGVVYGEVKGGKGSVRTPVYFDDDGNTFTHIHPRDNGIFGGTFSDADINVFSNYGVKTYRAVAKEGTY